MFIAHVCFFAKHIYDKELNCAMLDYEIYFCNFKLMFTLLASKDNTSFQQNIRVNFIDFINFIDLK